MQRHVSIKKKKERERERESCQTFGISELPFIEQTLPKGERDAGTPTGFEDQEVLALPLLLPPFTNSILYICV